MTNKNSWFKILIVFPKIKKIMIKIMKPFCDKIAAFTIQHTPTFSSTKAHENRETQLNSSTASLQMLWELQLLTTFYFNFYFFKLCLFFKCFGFIFESLKQIVNIILHEEWISFCNCSWRMFVVMPFVLKS